MAATTIGVVFSIYTLILIGTLILLLKYDDSIHQKNKKILSNSARTQGRITAVYHPQKKSFFASIVGKKKTLNETKKYSIVVVYEYKVKTKTKTLIGESTIHLDFQNTEVLKGRYKVGDSIDLLYQKDNPTLVSIASLVTPVKGENWFVVANIIAIASCLLVLGLLNFVGLSNTVEDAALIVFGFLMYLFVMLGSVIITFAGALFIKEHFKFLQLNKKGIKEKGEVLETWEIDVSRVADGVKGVSHHVRYTYPTIAPFYLETTVTSKLNEAIQKNKVVEVCYSKTDKFSSDIVGNKSIPHTFWLIALLIPLTLIIAACIFYGFVLYVFYPI
ncbi:MAG: hypothetical protein ACPGVB_08030 [Chitinophagales bacterium]